MPERRKIPLADTRAAAECVGYVLDKGGAATAGTSDGLAWVEVDAEWFPHVKNYWQHTGLILSSRRAEAWLAGVPDDLAR